MSRRTTRATAGDLYATLSIQPVSGNHIAPSTTMYLSNQYNHPAFNKLYLGPNLSGGKGAGSAIPKAPKAPEKPLMPYMRFSRKVWDDVKANQPELKLWEIGKIIGKMWRELPPGDKQLFMDEYDAEKLEYQDLLKSFHNSPAYQAYLQAKGRAEAVEAAENRASERDDACMSIETTDDDTGDTDEGYSVKHVAAARFQRNHRLMQDITADSSSVPSGRGIVTKQRLDILRNQVQSLERHQTKLHKELLEIEDNHAIKKNRWKENSNKFFTEMKRLRNMTPQEYYAEYKKKQQMLKEESLKEAAANAASSNAEKKADTAKDETITDKVAVSSGSTTEESNIKDDTPVKCDIKQNETEKQLTEGTTMDVSVAEKDDHKSDKLSSPEEDTAKIRSCIPEGQHVEPPNKDDDIMESGETEMSSENLLKPSQSNEETSTMETTNNTQKES